MVISEAGSLSVMEGGRIIEGFYMSDIREEKHNEREKHTMSAEELLVIKARMRPQRSPSQRDTFDEHLSRMTRK